MALSYLSLACAVLFGIAGQIALKSGAVGARQHRGAARPPADHHRVRDLRRRRALLHRRAEQIAGVDRIPVGRRQLCDRRGHRASVMERAAGLAAARRHPADRRRHLPDPPALNAGGRRDAGRHRRYNMSPPTPPPAGRVRAASRGGGRRRMGRAAARPRRCAPDRATARRIPTAGPTRRSRRPRQRGVRSAGGAGSVRGCASPRCRAGGAVFNSRSRCMSMSPSSATRHTALSVSRSELRTSLTASPSASLKIAIRLASLAGGSGLVSASFLSSDAAILSRSTPPLVADLNGFSLYVPTEDTQNSSIGSVSSRYLDPARAKPFELRALFQQIRDCRR